MILLLDNFDSFTYNLVDYFQQLGVDCAVLRNNASLNEVEELSFAGICLSPGPETPDRAGIMSEVIERYHQQVPMLGICLGHQALGTFFGASLAKALRPMHGKLSEVKVIAEDPLFSGVENPMHVVRYHSLVLKDLPTDIEATALTAENEIMAIRHRRLPLHGVQFHPEAWLTQHGLDILRNWVGQYRLAGDTTNLGFSKPKT